MISEETTCPEGFPSHLWEGFKLYVLHGVPPGSFLRAFFVGDFHEMCRRGGEGVLEMWPAVMYLHNHCPVGCFGSEEAVQEWCRTGGLVGRRGENRVEQAKEEEVR